MQRVLGPVVQSIARLTNSLIKDLSNLLMYIKSSVLIHFAEKKEQLLQKAPHIFPAKHQQCYDIKTEVL